MKKGSFILYDKDLQGVLLLSDYYAGRLFKAVAKYRLTGEKTDFGNNLTLMVLFQQIVDHIEMNEEKYQEVCEKRSQASRKRWDKDKNNPNESNCINLNANECLYDNDNDNENVNVNDNVNGNDNNACGAKRENKRKKYYNKNEDIKGEPSYDLELFRSRIVGLDKARQ